MWRANQTKTKVIGKSKQNESPWLVNPKRKSLGNQTMCKSNFLRIEYACIKYRKKADNACLEGIFFHSRKNGGHVRSCNKNIILTYKYKYLSATLKTFGTSIIYL